MRRAHRFRRMARHGYHHGNLKEALVAAAKQLIIEKGPHGFSLVEAARLADVSPAAPYRHYPDRNALLSEVARRGFALFVNRLDAAWDSARPDAQTAFRRLGRAYIKFACEERAFYAAMFMAGTENDADPELNTKRDQAFSLLHDAAKAIVPPSSSDPLTVSLHIWALSHGIATLFAQRQQTQQETLPDPISLLDSGVKCYLKGLGIEMAQSSPPSKSS